MNIEISIAKKEILRDFFFNLEFRIKNEGGNPAVLDFFCFNKRFSGGQ